MRKITLLILLLCFTLNAWTYDFTSGSFSYNIISETEQTVEVFYNEYTKTVSIPETVRYNGKTYTVVKIGAEAFYSRKELETVYIPKTVKEIGARAFAYCSYLKNVNCLGQELEIIGREAFCYTSITSFNFPPTLKSIGFAAFSNSDLGGNITIPNSVTVLGKSVFLACKISSVTLGNGIQIIPENAFDNCINLASVVIPESVHTIENYAFKWCEKLTSIYLRPMSPPAIVSLSAFFLVAENVTLYVPCGAENNYILSEWVSVTSNITEICSEVHISAQSTTGGTITGVGTYTYGDKVTLTAVPDVHYHFVRWSDGSTENPRTLTVYKSASFSAKFAIDTHDVVVNESKNGIVTGAGTYNYGDTAILTATANDHYHFVRWSDDNTDNPRSYVVTNDATLTAEFAVDTHNVVVSESKNGTVTGAGTYNYGDTVTLNAFPIEGYHFVRWSNGNSQKILTFIITEDIILSAEFSINIYKIVVTADNGTVTGAGTYNHGDIVTLNAFPIEGYHFVRWSNGSIKNPLTFVATEDLTLKAEISPNTYEIVTSAENGTIIGAGTYNYGDVATLTAVANDHYHFVRWSDGNIDNPRVITVTQDAIFVAEFAVDTHEIIVNAAQNGTASGSGIYNFGETITLTATPNAHYHFSKWSDGNTDNPRSYVVSQDAALTAEFTIDTHDVVVSGSENAIVTGTGTYNYGDTVTLSITPNEGYKFVRWSDGNTDNPRTIIVTEDITFGVELELHTYIVSVSCNGSHGSVSGSGTYKHGETIVITATANDGFKFTQWNDGDINAQRTLIVTSDTTLIATFEEIQCKLTLASNDPIMGSVFGEGIYKYGTKVSINAVANTGYQFTQWSDNDTNASRTITITSDLSLTAYFQPMKYTIIATANDEALGTVYGGGEYTYNTSVSLMAVANEGAEFVTWTNGVVENPYIFKAVENMAIQAIFKTIPSGVDDIQVKENITTKILQNGQLLIIRDGKTYTVMGQEVK